MGGRDLARYAAGKRYAPAQVQMRQLNVLSNGKNLNRFRGYKYICGCAYVYEHDSSGYICVLCKAIKVRNYIYVCTHLYIYMLLYLYMYMRMYTCIYEYVDFS